ncbi:MAG: hypothetical protein Q8L68_00930, partial [Methylococcales bacterium]|nr:hypothetical protein [Methylococcales bacterium]
MNFSRWLMIGCMVVLLSACLPLGPTALPGNRLGYNVALYNSGNTQLLLNIVRVRYGGGIYFLDVSAISAQAVAEAGWSGFYPTYSQTSSNSGISALGRTLEHTFRINPEASYADKPTISYTPLQGSKVTTQFLEPLPMQSLYLLIRSGWSLYKVLRMTVQRIGPINNIPAGVGKMSRCLPPNLKFLQLTRYLHDLEATNDLSFSLEKYVDPALKNEVNLSSSLYGKNLPENTRLAIMMHFSHTKRGNEGK